MRVNKITKILFLAAIAHAVSIMQGSANNISVANVTPTAVSTNGGFMYVQVDLAWQNSWRVSVAPSNWDAAWVFVKYRKADGIWRHAHLSTNNLDHIVPPGATVSVGTTSNLAVGAFIYRSANGVGNVNWPAVQLRWNYAADGVLASDLVTVDVSALEMVYVPTGSFYVGDGSSPYSLQNGINSQPYFVNGPGPITIGPTPGNIWLAPHAVSIVDLSQYGPGQNYHFQMTNDMLDPGLAGASVAIPNGYNAFYCMKYSCTGDELGNFLQKTGRGAQPVYDTGTGTYMPVVSSENEVLTYLNWSGLRPMSELEYEKACRGSVYPVPNEYCWGSALIGGNQYAILQAGAASESISSGYSINAGNAAGLNGATNKYGPLRAGIFSLSAYSGTTPARIQSGSTYYGIQDMTGSVGEAVYPVVQRTPCYVLLQYVGGSGNYVFVSTLITNTFVYSGNLGDGTAVVNPAWNPGLVSRGLAGRTSFYPLTVSDRSPEAQYNAGNTTYTVLKVPGGYTNIYVQGVLYTNIYQADVVKLTSGVFGVRGVRPAP